MATSKAPLTRARQKDGRPEDDMAPMEEEHEMPRLIAPRPLYATTLPPLMQVDSNRSNQSQLSAEVRGTADGSRRQLHTPERMQDMSPSSSSLRAAADPQAILPIKGGDGDAMEAVEKLERMQRALQSKRKWLRNTGMEGLTTAATAGGKKESPQKGKDMETASISSIPEYGEVKLGISSLPGYNILAARRAKQRHNRANTLAVDGKDRPSIDNDEEGNTSLLRKISRHTPTIRHRRKESVSAPKIDLNDPPKETIQAQTDAAPSVPAKEEPARVVAANPDLTSVKEEARLEETLQQPTRAPPTLDIPEANKRMLPRHLRPLLMLQSPSENGMQAQPSEMQPAQTSSRAGSPFDSSHNALNGRCDDLAQEAADNCQRNVMQSASLYTGFEEAIQDSPSASSGESEGEGSQSDSEASSIAPTQQEEYVLSLEHGNELNVKEKKKLLKRMRKSNGPVPQADPEAKYEKSARQYHARKGSLSNRVQVGLHYASSQSRNRRAMEKYSPHPSRPGSAVPFTPISSPQPKTDSGSNLADLLASARRMSTTTMSPSTTQPFGLAGDLSRSSTPSLLLNRDGAVGSRRSSLSDRERVLGSAAETGEGEFCLSPIAADNAIDRDEQWAELAKSAPKRQGTANSLASSLTGQVPFRKKYFSLRRRKQNTSDVVEESDSDDEARVKEDADKELDHVLRNLIAEQAPEELKEQYEYDVLYENQRGLMFFGIPKFSAKTLFQWDPAPWTNGRNGNSAYNIVNAQLPNPSWEWVHPEWLIDMSGDVDESGWQYSYNFGRFSFSFSTRPAQVVPRANAENNVIMNERMTKEREGRGEGGKEKEDHGFEALKRTAKIRGAKWKGIPDQNKYVRRRRWIRLRRRKPTQFAGPTPRETPGKTTPLKAGRSSVDWANLTKGEEEEKRKKKLPEEIQDITLSSSSSADEEETISSLESDEADEYGTDGATSSSFLPRRTPGVLSSDSEVGQRKHEREKDLYKRHAKEFSGTIRELKSLLPAILEPRGQHRTLTRRQAEHDVWMKEVDARNPFLSWNLVKRRLEDDDMAFATASLRARERRYSQKVSKRRGSQRGTIDGHSGEGLSIRDQSFDLTKDAVVEINYRRVMRVMKACRVDRQKILLWKIWLGIESIAAMSELGQDEDFATTGSGIAEKSRQGDSLRHARVKWRKATTHLDTMDVWDLLERRLDSLLLTFEYQGSRSTLLLILLSIHASSHANHRFRPSRWMMNIDGQDNAEANAPSTLSPHFGSRENWKEDGSSADGASFTAPAGDEWRAVKLPRLEFWSDLERCAKALTEASQATSPSLRGDDASPPYHPSPPPLMQSTFSRASPVPSMNRSNTPQASMGSLSNGPSARRYSQNTFVPPHPSHSASMVGSSYGRPSSVAKDRDHSFLAELLQLPEHTTIT